VGIYLVECLLLHLGRVEQFKFVTEQTVVSVLKLFNKIKSLHLDKSRLDICSHMIQIRLEHKRVKETIGTCLEVSLVIV